MLITRAENRIVRKNPISTNEDCLTLSSFQAAQAAPKVLEEDYAI